MYAGMSASDFAKIITAGDIDFRVNVMDLSRLITKLYGVPFSDQQANMRGQNSYQIIDATDDDVLLHSWQDDEAKALLTAWLSAVPDDETLAECVAYPWRMTMWHERHNTIPLQVIMWDLVRQDLIPRGRYLVVCWW